jgi:hypothetical protein
MRICPALVAAAGLVLLLGGCGADGVPLRPAAQSDGPVAMAMQARLGLSGQSR